MMCEPPKIQKLDETVINRIAAGEVIQRPANALKELIENSLDAKSTNIQIVVKNGGLKLLQIQDNGIGIRREDFEIVCERFTTSKLRKFEDLNSIATYGFRGEALASISHVAHLTILSKTLQDRCAYKACYEDGKLKEPPKPTAGNQGTQITVEDLFYNMAVRKRALRSIPEEYQKISDVVGKYAIHNAKVGFGLKKQGENNDIRTPTNSTQIDNIRTIYGNNIARELIEFNLEDEKLKFQAKGYMTNVNYSTKKFNFLLFINHRLVDCSSLKKSIDQVYTTYLPKNMHPFVYLSLELDPKNIDVNVHPTKHEVHFMDEDQIVEALTSTIEKKLLGSNNSRIYYTQAKLPVTLAENLSVADKTKSNKTIPDKDFVRTDAMEQKLDKFFSIPIKVTGNKLVELNQSLNEEEFSRLNKEMLKRSEKFENQLLERNESIFERTVEGENQDIIVGDKKTIENENILLENTVTREKTREEIKTEIRIMERLKNKVTRCETELQSVLELRKAIEDDCHMLLRHLFAQHVFVGPVNSVYALVQHETKLYLCNTKKIMEELFYQFIMYNFHNFDKIKFSEPLPLNSLALLALNLPEAGWTLEDGDKEDLAKRVAEILIEKGEMLNEYFSVDVDKNGNLKSLPLILDKHVPEMSELPMYILRLATEVEWDSEKECFETFARETALYYSKFDENNCENNWRWITEHIFYPSMKEYFMPPKSFGNNAAILEIANLPNLYKVFERC